MLSSTKTCGRPSKRGASGGASFITGAKTVHSFGKTLPFAPVYDSAGGLVNLIAVKEDITARKLLEAADRDQRQLAEAFRDSAATLNSTLKLEEVLDRILDNIGKMAPYDAVVLFLIEGDLCTHSPPAQQFISYARAKCRQFSIQNNRPSLLQSLLETGQPCLISDTQADLRCSSIFPNLPAGPFFGQHYATKIRGGIIGAEPAWPASSRNSLPR